jgi:hypothetical protein
LLLKLLLAKMRTILVTMVAIIAMGLLRRARGFVTYGQVGAPPSALH